LFCHDVLFCFNHSNYIKSSISRFFKYFFLFLAPISCPQPNVPAGAVINSPKNIYMAGDVVSYSCNSGYTMYGQATITCQQDGSYSAPFPQCMGKKV